MATLARSQKRLGLDSRLWSHVRTHLNIALQTPSPASLEIETMPYPTTHPDPSVFEPMSEEYVSMSTPGTHSFTPLTSSDTLLSLIMYRNFQTAESLRKEMISHHIPIPPHVLYLRAALHTITDGRTKRSEKERLHAFEAWLSLAPDRSEDWRPYPFHDIRRRLFRSMDHLNLNLIYRFGLILASKGYYSGYAAMQVISTLAHYAQFSIVEKYLREIEVASRNYHLKKDISPPSDALVGAYNLSIKTVALRGKGEATLALISMAHSRGIHVPYFTLNFAAKHAPDQKAAIDYIQVIYPDWTMQDTNTHPVRSEYKTVFAGRTADITVLATRLRALRNAIRSPYPPSPHALRGFMESYQALGRVRALSLLQSLAYSSPRSASTWALTRMLHHRSQRELIHLLLVFFYHFHLVGVPRKTLLSLVRGTRGKQAQKDVKRWVGSPWLINEKLRPTAYHTALVWDAIVSLSSKIEKERLYTLLLSLVRESKRPESEPDARQVPEAVRPRVQLRPDTYDAAHFSPFVSSWARRTPLRAASVLQDMIHFGIEPSVIQWSMVARGYAQHNDPLVALRILDRVEGAVRSRSQNGVDEGNLPEDLLGIHTNVLRGFVFAGDLEHAREVERRLLVQFGFQAGSRPATDASIALLRRLECKF